MVMTSKRAARKARTKALMDAIHDTTDNRDVLIRKAVAAIDARDVKYNTFEAELQDALLLGYLFRR